MGAVGTSRHEQDQACWDCRVIRTLLATLQDLTLWSEVFSVVHMLCLLPWEQNHLFSSSCNLLVRRRLIFEVNISCASVLSFDDFLAADTSITYQNKSTLNYIFLFRDFGRVGYSGFCQAINRLFLIIKTTQRFIYSIFLRICASNSFFGNNHPLREPPPKSTK